MTEDVASSRDDRRAKLERLRSEGVDPFPHQFDVVPVETIHAAHDGLEAGEETDQSYRVAGRLVARRGHGGAAFLDLVDRSGRIQLHARKDALGEESFERLVGLDLGDLIGVDGTALAIGRVRSRPECAGPPGATPAIITWPSTSWA